MQRRTWQWIGVAGWLLALGVSTTVRCHVWTSDLSLWTDAAAKAPLKPRPVINEGRAHELAGQPEWAEAAYVRVIGLTWDTRRPAALRRYSKAAAETNLAHLHMKRGELASAMRILDDVARDWPDFPYAHYNRATIFWAYGLCDHAWTEYRRAFLVDPSLPQPKGTCDPSSTP